MKTKKNIQKAIFFLLTNEYFLDKHFPYKQIPF